MTIRYALFSAAVMLTCCFPPGARGCQQQHGDLAVQFNDLRQFRIVVVGERHGTKEIPGFVAALACTALVDGRAVTLALEMPSSETDRLESYLASDGGATARSRLVTSPFWHRPLQDGRSSAAMVDLLEARMSVSKRSMKAMLQMRGRRGPAADLSAISQWLTP